MADTRNPYDSDVVDPYQGDDVKNPHDDESADDGQADDDSDDGEEGDDDEPGPAAGARKRTGESVLARRRRKAIE